MLKVIISLALIFSFGGSLLAGTQSCGGGRGCSMSGKQMMECCRKAQESARESMNAAPCCAVNNEHPASPPTAAVGLKTHDVAPLAAQPAVSHFSTYLNQPFLQGYLSNAYTPSLQSAYLHHLSLLI